ncbi:hypothetical protein PFISCL1PPCAC_2418, partial [Pristionchus fissidentatus]
LFLLLPLAPLISVIWGCYWKKKEVKVAKQLKVTKKPKKRDDFLTRLRNQITNEHDENSISKTAEGDESKKKTKVNKDLMRPSREHVDSPNEELLPTGEKINEAYEKIGLSHEKVGIITEIGIISILQPQETQEKSKEGSKEVIPVSGEKTPGSKEKTSGSKEQEKEKEKKKEEKKESEADLNPLKSTQSSTKKTEFTPSSCSNTQHNSKTNKSHRCKNFRGEIYSIFAP